MKKKIIPTLIICLAVAMGMVSLKPNEAHKGYQPPHIGANSPETVVIASARIINPRLPSLKPDEFNRVILELQKNINTHLGITVKLLFESHLDIKDFFKNTRTFKGGKEKLIKNYLTKRNLKNINTKDELAKALESFITNKTEHLNTKELLTFYNQSTSKPLSTNPEVAKNKSSIANLIADIHHQKFHEYRKIKLDDGTNLLQEDDYNEFELWASYLDKFPYYNFIVTNQPLISFRDPSPAIHSSLRGGITVGFAERTGTTYGSTIVISTFPFIFDNKLLNNQRDFETSSEEVPKLIGAYATHEFGHALAYWGHYFQKGCIMNPARGLKFKTWYKETRDKANCKAEYQEDFKSYFLTPFPE